jgi:type I restriction enzyme S subunit
MRILKHKSFEYSEVSLAELGQEMRFDADYWEPSYLRNEDIISAKKHSQTKGIAPNPQYGISVAMNEDGNGYSILKMDNIMAMLAEDKDAKFADISEKIFNQFQLKKFDVLFNRVNSDDFVGRTGIYLLDGKHTFASYLVRVNSGKDYTNCYLTVYLNCKYGKTALQRVKRRAVNQANINAKELSNLNIPLPSDVLQKQMQTLIVEAQKQKILSEKLFLEAEQIFLTELGLESWKSKVVKFKYYDVSIEVENTVNSKASLEEMLQSNRLDSEFWQPKYILAETILKNKGQFKPLSQIAVLRKGNQARTEQANQEGIPYASIKDCNNLEIITNEFTDSKKPVTVQSGELVMAITGATIGKVAINNTPNQIAISGDLTAIQNDTVPQHYLLVVLASDLIQDLSKRYTTGATNGHLSIRDVARFPIPLIDKKKMIKIEEKMKAAFKNNLARKLLLKTAVRATEIFIEQDEKAALKYIKENIKE